MLKYFKSVKILFEYTDSIANNLINYFGLAKSQL